MYPETFAGVYTALITPFDNRNQFDRGRFAEQISRQIAGGVTGIVPVGTTGESPTLDFDEHIDVIKAAVEFAGRKVKVIAGTGGNCTKEAIFLAQSGEQAGADALLQVAPYYNKPSQAGLFAHFDAVAKATRLPIFLYNIPGRCGVDILVDTVCKLHEANPNIMGIKEAGGSTDRVTELRLKLGKDFVILCGDDSLALPFLSVGADGVVSVVSNVVPEAVSELVLAGAKGDFVSARAIHMKLFPFTKSLFLEGNPVGVKCAMKQLGWDRGTLRLPMFEASEETARHIQRQLVVLKLL